MIARIARPLVFAAVVLSLALSGWTARAQDAEVLLADTMPPGVAFETLAVVDATSFRFHLDGLRLDRIRIRCGQVTGKIFGMEQITYVEYGVVEVRDWDTGETIETLSAGEVFGPTTSEGSYYLASPENRQSSVFRFSAHASGAIGNELPDATYRRCGSGATREVDAEAASVETIFASDEVGNTNPGGVYTLYVGLLTVKPGASVSRTAPSVDADSGQYTAIGAGLILPIVGGFGTGFAGQAGSAGPEVFPGEAAWMTPGTVLALENHGLISTTALVFGALPVDATVLTTR